MKRRGFSGAARIIHVGRKAPKGYVELTPAIHIGKGIWMFNCKLAEKRVTSSCELTGARNFPLTGGVKNGISASVMAKEQIARDVGQPIPTVSSSSHNNHVSAMGRGVLCPEKNEKILGYRLVSSGPNGPAGLQFPCSVKPWSTPTAESLNANDISLAGKEA